jgi:hypothetical protein
MTNTTNEPTNKELNWEMKDKLAELSELDKSGDTEKIFTTLLFAERIAKQIYERNEVYGKRAFRLLSEFRHAACVRNSVPAQYR